jgi:hypothetical protein
VIEALLIAIDKFECIGFSLWDRLSGWEVDTPVQVMTCKVGPHSPPSKYAGGQTQGAAGGYWVMVPPLGFPILYLLGPRHMRMVFGWRDLMVSGVRGEGMAVLGHGGNFWGGGKICGDILVPVIKAEL